MTSFPRSSVLRPGWSSVVDGIVDRDGKPATPSARRESAEFAKSKNSAALRMVRGGTF
jgi:hypothetical protein